MICSAGGAVIVTFVAGVTQSLASLARMAYVAAPRPLNTDASCQVVPLSREYLYGGTPPIAVMLICPSIAPLQLSCEPLKFEVTVADSTTRRVGSVRVTENSA